jgi:tetratricopeptide (TPR) repeat protein
MKTFLLAFVLLCAAVCGLSAQSPILLGQCTRDSLLQEPHREWFQKNYDEYEPDATVIEPLKNMARKGFEVEIFFGTWCGDTRRELPRFVKTLDLAGWEQARVRYIAVDSALPAYKQSPGGETLNKGIYRVPTFIIMKNGKEAGRIVEHPVESLEADLLAIAAGQDYQPNFFAYSEIERLLADGTLVHPNTSLKGIAKSLKPLVISWSELNACGYVFQAQKKLPEALAVFRINHILFNENVDTHIALANCLYKNGLYQEAVTTLQGAISLNKDDAKLDKMLELYYVARKAQE